MRPTTAGVKNNDLCHTKEKSVPPSKVGIRREKEGQIPVAYFVTKFGQQITLWH